MIIFLPNSLDKTQLKMSVLHSLDEFADEFSDLISNNLSKSLGPNWFDQIKIQRNDVRLNLRDSSFIFSEMLASDSIFRDFLPKDPKFFSIVINVKRFRNRFTHNNQSGDTKEALAALEYLILMCEYLKLNKTINMVSQLISRINQMKQGKRFNGTDLSTFSLEKNNAAAEIRAKKEFDDLEKLKKNREFLLEKVAILEIQASQNPKLKHLIEITNAKLTKLNEALTAQKIRANNSDLQAKKLRNLLITIVHGKNEGNDSKAAPKLKPGSTWKASKGKYRLILSPSRIDLIDKKTNQSISDFFEVNSKSIAREWLKIRITGGAVFVDEEGNATTPIENSLIYLGNLNLTKKRKLNN